MGKQGYLSTLTLTVISTLTLILISTLILNLISRSLGSHGWLSTVYFPVSFECSRWCDRTEAGLGIRAVINLNLNLSLDVFCILALGLVLALAVNFNLTHTVNVTVTFALIPAKR
jgi:hypothetical protein